MLCFFYYLFFFFMFLSVFFFFFFFNDTATTEIYTAQYTLSLHDALPIHPDRPTVHNPRRRPRRQSNSSNVLALRIDRKSTRLNSSHIEPSRMPSSA